MSIAWNLMLLKHKVTVLRKLAGQKSWTVNVHAGNTVCAREARLSLIGFRIASLQDQSQIQCQRGHVRFVGKGKRAN
jgi:hypothetical protein